MEIRICSRKEVEGMLAQGRFPEHAAVISFYSPERTKSGDYAPVDYRNRAERLFLACVPDLDIEALEHFGYTYETFFPDADALARFVREAVRDGLQILCQCGYGQSRSAACCAAILEYYEHSGITVFADYRYYPNQLVFNRVLQALRAQDGT